MLKTNPPSNCSAGPIDERFVQWEATIESRNCI